MINLKDCTFIIPLKVEHDDRYRNAFSVLGFLNYYFKTNIIIHELSIDGKSRLDFLQGLSNLEISHSVHMLNTDDFFHRTKYLNLMLDKVKTPVVINYDIDVILPVESYVQCRNSILKGEADVYYPYIFGLGQYKIEVNINRENFHQHYNLDILLEDILKRVPSNKVNIYPSEYGHCVFFNTTIYKKFGGENEEFKSYGPEDKERALRFKKIGRIVKWLDAKVFHFEHWRGNDSSSTNPYLSDNHKLLDVIECMTSVELLNYYKNAEYRKKYKTLRDKL